MLAFNTIVYDPLRIVRNFNTIVYIFFDCGCYNRTIAKSLSSVIVAWVVAVVLARIVARITPLAIVVLRVVTRIRTSRIEARIIARIVTVAIAIGACRVVVEFVSSTLFAHYALALRAVVF